MTLDELKEKINKDTLAARSLSTVVEKAQFERAWRDSTDVQKQVALVYIKNLDRKGLLAWCNSFREDGERGLQELRLIAKKLGISNYGRLDKATLLFNIGLRNEKK